MFKITKETTFISCVLVDISLTFSYDTYCSLLEISVENSFYYKYYNTPRL